MATVLTPYGFATEAEIEAFFGLGSGTLTDRHRDSANDAAGIIAELSGRNLAARVYREPVTLTACSLAATGSKVTRASGLSALRVLDDVVGHAEVGVGNRVASITNDGELTLERAVTDETPVTLTFGSEPLIASGYGTDVLQSPEFPVQEVYAVRVLANDGTSTAVDITGLRVEKQTGRLILPGGVWTEGDANYEIDCMAGFRAPSATVRGDYDDWRALRRAYLRLTQVIFQDEVNARGRKVTQSLGPSAMTIEGFEVPADIADIVTSYRRLWG